MLGTSQLVSLWRVLPHKSCVKNTVHVVLESTTILKLIKLNDLLRNVLMEINVPKGADNATWYDMYFPKDTC